MSAAEDAGWRPVLSAVWRGMIPGLGLTRAARSRMPVDVLFMLRRMWCGLVAALLLYWFVLAFIAPGRPGGAAWFPYVLTAYAVGISAIVVRQRRRIVADNLQGLSLRYRTVFFICVGLSSSIALFAFTGTFIMNSRWIYPYGFAMALFGMWWTAPTTRHLERDQQRIRDAGSSLSLLEALLTTPRTPPPSG